VVNAYTLVFGGFLLLGGRAADLLGRKRLFLAGITVFTLASLLNGLAESSSMLIAGRALQGLGGALVSPAALSILMTSFPGTQERTKALGVWSAIVAGGAAAGLLLGGVLTDLLSWEWVFFVNVPVGILAVAAALRFVPESRDEQAHRTFDLAGAVTVTGGLIVLVYAIVKAQTFGWGSTRTLAMLAAAALLLAAFVAVERRSAAPLVRLNIFRTRTLTAANVALMLVGSGMFSMFFFASLYVQELLGYSPLKAGLAFLPVTAGIMIGAGIAQTAIRRFGPRQVPVVGLLIATFGMVWLTALPVHGSYVSDLLAGLFPMSLGMGLTFVPVTLLATVGVPAEDSGLASGLLNTSQQVGGALGLAILSTLAANHTTSLLTSGTARPLALLGGWHVAFTGGAVVLALAALSLVVLLRRRHLAHVDVDVAVPMAA
jgi:EmrB/QacA subfamily drug resistance transporter